ncbi:O-antigen ligase family protein [Paenibacillus kobensis]|uniref:O-antigen ligase family protein n=1 Tax=Paenibacillus kobensis TaxID=59841 RepID=UPI000FD7566C|nr:O-antigen ligase family protein [Paenibacillus kobensis]
MRAHSLQTNILYLLIAIILSSLITLTRLDIVTQLLISLVLVSVIIYLMNPQKIFWYFIVLMPLLPPYLAYKAGGAPFVNGFRILLLIFIFDQLILKRRVSEFISSIRSDKFKVVVLIYAFGIIISGLVRASMFDMSSNLISSTAIIVEKVVFYYLILMNINIEVQKGGHREFINKFLHRISVVAFILAILGILEYFSQFNIFSLLDVSNYEGLKYHPFIRSGQLRVSSSFSHTLGYVMYLLIMIPIVFYQATWAAKEGKKKRVFYFSLILLLILNLFMTLSRSAMLAATVAVVTYAVFSVAKSRMKFIFAVFYIVFPLLFLSLTPVGKDIPGVSTIGSNINALSDALLGTQKVENFGNNEDPFVYRNALIKYSFQLKGNEAIWGKGIGFIENEPLEFYLPEIAPFVATISRSIDNYYILTKLEQGWVGLVVTLILFITVVFTAIRYRRKNNLNLMILVSFLAYFVQLFMVADLDTIKYFWMFLAVLSVFHSYNANEELPKRESRNTICNQMKNKEGGNMNDSSVYHT